MTLLIQFCSLMIYLARIPKALQGYVLGMGILLIVITEEKDFMSFRYALVPLAFNNGLLFISQCVLSRKQ